MSENIQEKTAVAVQAARPTRRQKQTVVDANSEVGVNAARQGISKADLEAKNAREREIKAKMVTGKFLFNECPGGEIRFVYREFPGDPLIKYVMKHDTIHTIPLGVAMHLNDRCSYPEFAHNMDNGKSINGEQLYVTTMVHRTNFIPLDFTINAGNTGPSLSMVTNTNPMENQYSPINNGR